MTATFPLVLTSALRSTLPAEVLFVTAIDPPTVMSDPQSMLVAARLPVIVTFPVAAVTPDPQLIATRAVSTNVISLTRIPGAEIERILDS